MGTNWKLGLNPDPFRRSTRRHRGEDSNLNAAQLLACLTERLSSDRRLVNHAITARWKSGCERNPTRRNGDPNSRYTAEVHVPRRTRVAPNVKPNEPDQFKLHNEINQCVNQRFLLTGASVTLFGIIARHLLPGVSEPKLDEIITSLLLSLTYSILLMAFFWQSQQLRKMMRTYSSYLIQKGLSEWEQDWYEFRDNREQLF